MWGRGEGSRTRYGTKRGNVDVGGFNTTYREGIDTRTGGRQVTEGSRGSNP